MISDIICQVYFDSKSSEKIFELLNFYLPQYQPLKLDYTSKIDGEFNSNQEMIDYFVNTNNISQTFYWNQYINNPEKVMFGVDMTNDNKTIFSLTFDGTIEQAEIYLIELKQKLDSDIGFISFINPIEYDNGIDFKNKY
ncbi:hypothetical protein [Chryseobacterium sp. ERMR1:04]|uniref:hypothetical protein n=1 Tax=Chryseobacterium sp. ERMR1:04 TaxID=1705393 RepID=UPI0006C85A33|nr:hypothetical protein [Chryseobacterium sp. ERMR1:04]KPH13736.1 hypothetical protein AMQ68_09335 [Chryseobacterium sp. ERMR1:04]